MTENPFFCIWIKIVHYLLADISSQIIFKTPVWSSFLKPPSKYITTLGQNAMQFELMQFEGDYSKFASLYEHYGELGAMSTAILVVGAAVSSTQSQII